MSNKNAFFKQKSTLIHTNNSHNQSFLLFILPFLPSFFPFLMSLLHSPQLGLFTTTSCSLKLRCYSASGTPAAMQQSKQNVILYHLHPWERCNEEERVQHREGGRKKLYRLGTESGKKEDEHLRLLGLGEGERNSGGVSERETGKISSCSS